MDQQYSLRTFWGNVISMKWLKIGLLDLFTACQKFSISQRPWISQRPQSALVWCPPLKVFLFCRDLLWLYSRASTNSHRQIGFALDDIYVIEGFFIVTLKRSNINLSRDCLPKVTFVELLETYAQKTHPWRMEKALESLREIFTILMSKTVHKKNHQLGKREFWWTKSTKNADFIHHSLIWG